MKAGFIVNLRKSHLTPTQDLVFLGARLQTHLGRISLPQEKAASIVSLVMSFRTDQEYTARQWLRLLGVMAATIPTVHIARLRMRPVQWYFHSQWNSSRQSLLFKVGVTPQVHRHLEWWTDIQNLLSGLPLFPVQEHCVITTDASSLGWGGVLDGIPGSRRQMVQGQWTIPQQEWHINVKELMAVFLTLQHFRLLIGNVRVLIRSDNSTTCAYINKKGGTRSRTLCQLAIQLWGWCLEQRVDLSAVHVPGVQNVLADSLSRWSIDQREWSLHGQVTNHLFRRWGQPLVDLFATCHNCKVPTFCSLYPFPGALTQDAFSISWNVFTLTYAFPPMVLINRVLQKVRLDRTDLILITPRWPMRS